MRTKPAFTPCTLFYDGGARLEVGDYLKTPGGSAYLIQTVRQNRNRAYRRHLGCVRWPVEDIPDNAVVHALHWYVRKKKPGRRLAEFA
jgi:hypothetical protein